MHSAQKRAWSVIKRRDAHRSSSTCVKVFPGNALKGAFALEKGVSNLYLFGLNNAK